VKHTLTNYQFHAHALSLTLLSSLLLLLHFSLSSSLYSLSLSLSLNPRVVKDLIDQVLVETLKGKEYDQNETGTWTKEIATVIKGKLKGHTIQHKQYCIDVFMMHSSSAYSHLIYLHSHTLSLSFFLSLSF
jgi:hypothetical protein